MKLKRLSRVLAVVLCVMLLVSCIPFQASAETTQEAISMVAGNQIVGFVPAGTDTESTDLSVAWVDSIGNLNAMKEGTATITVKYTDEVLDTIAKIDAIGEVQLTDECKTKIDAARNAYEALTTTEKDRVYNYDDLVAAEKAYEALKEAQDDEKLAEDMAEFKQYKIDNILEAELMLDPDDPFECDVVIALAQELISATNYNPNKSLEENKAVVDGIMDLLRQRLDEIRDPEPEPQPDPEPAVMTGDVNNDGVIDIMDSILVQKYTSDEAELTPEQLEAADVNGDGSVYVLDAMDIQKYASDKISEFSKKA